MRDGTYMQHDQVRPLGGAVLFLIGSSYSSFAEFAESADGPIHRSEDPLYAPKGPDFISCLRGYVDILGPDCVGGADRMYPIRRALLLRSLLEERAPGLMVGDHILIDEAVLNAFLTVPNYRHGARSLERILAMSTISGRRTFERASLPPEAQLNLHVNGKAFMDRVRYPRLPPALCETLAKELFVAYKQQRREMAKTAAEKQALDADPAMCDWEDLPEESKESTRMQADDIPHKLRMINCYMAKEGNGRRPLTEFTARQLEMLAEREHERWNAEKLHKQWRTGPRNASARTTPFLVPWRDLEEKFKDVDRAMVRCVPQLLPTQGYCIYYLGKGAE
ncbi:MAG: hypothetical protein M1816_007682 [Peltula sp. TS41687]|nr:MAG: hypothetical protein M1816_007682 [Peltula sp. TS41687]